ncbi:MAG: glycosyltransferase family 4 protein [Geobacteraceae bacterium]|nr:glycosyltransferase family 4 protein [Geobacteraceae bacterium]
MVGPDPSGMGGISRVARLWQLGGFFSDFQIEYISSVAGGAGKLRSLIPAFLRFTYACLIGGRTVYIHTASYNSFYRKCLFMVPAVLMRRRLIIHIHPSYFSQFLSSLGGAKKFMARFLLSRAHAFIVLTPAIKEDMSRLFPGMPIHVLNNPIDIKGMENSSNIERRPNHVLFLGWYMKRKGVYELVDALGILRKENIEVRADFYGTKEIEELRSYVAACGLSDVVRINGWIGEEDKLKALYSCTMLVLPSHTEGVPNVILEAMATRTPIVSTLVGGLRDILRDGENAVIAKPENAEDLGQRIRMVLQDDTLAGRIAETAYREACDKYDLPVVKIRFKMILDSICNQRMAAE